MIILVAMLVASTGCQEKAKTNANDFAGVYALVEVDGVSIPATVSHGGHDIMVHSGSFTIDPGGTCSSEMIFGPPSGGKHTRKVDATYTRASSTLKMKWKGAGRTKGTIAGDTFSMNNEGMMLVYKKNKEQDK